MKSDIELIEYFNKRGWVLNQKKLQLMIAAYNLGYYDANVSKPEVKNNE